MHATPALTFRTSVSVLVPCAALLLLLISACADRTEPVEEEPADAAVVSEALSDIAAVLREDPRFSTLAAAIDTTGLAETLHSTGPYTVFAPTNAAFDALPEDTLDALLQNEERLRTVLAYHVVAGKLTADEVQTMATLTTLSGADLAIAVEDSIVQFNPETEAPATIIEPNVEAGNGVIHIIDGVLMPTEQ